MCLVKNSKHTCPDIHANDGPTTFDHLSALQHSSFGLHVSQSFPIGSSHSMFCFIFIFILFLFFHSHLHTHPSFSLCTLDFTFRHPPWCRAVATLRQRFEFKESDILSKWTRVGDRCKKEFFEHYSGHRKQVTINQLLDGENLLEAQAALESHMLGFLKNYMRLMSRWTTMKRQGRLPPIH